MSSFGHNVKYRLGFQWFVLTKLPSLWFWGIKVAEISERRCRIQIKYSWFTKNPFQSIYFSALSGAAELSTGLMVQNKVLKTGNISMLVVHAESHFYKKAVGTIIFTCDEGDLVSDTFATLKNAGDQATLKLHSKGINEKGVEVAKFSFTWSLKKR